VTLLATFLIASFVLGLIFNPLFFTVPVLGLGALVFVVARYGVWI
jgi:hypothetical protein